jgi:uncharacterized membrane protein YhhN
VTRTLAMLFAAAALCAVAEIRAELLGPAWQVYLFKPATTLLLAAVAATAPATPSRRYRNAIVAGLACSLAGDVFLMLPGDFFLQGLVSFLAAHVCYIAAFTTGGPRLTPAVLVPYALFLATLLSCLWPYLGPLAVAVAVYGLALTVMAWQAAERWHVLRTAAAAAAASGAVLFVVSDSALAVNRFVGHFNGARLVIMGTYVAAQALIAASTRQPR